MIGVSQEAIVGASAYSRGRPSQIRHHTHEPLILMILVVAVKQRQSRIVGHEIDLDRAESRHIDRIFHHACGRLVANLGHLERVTMQVDRMVVAALVGHRETIAFSGLSGEQRIGIRPGFSVDSPAVVAAAAARHFLKQKIEPFIGKSSSIKRSLRRSAAQF